FVWHQLVRLLETKGVSTWSALHDWLAAPVEPTPCRRRVWPMPRDIRLSLPHAPGIYRMLRTDASLLYVRKPPSIHSRLNSYFRKQNGVPERSLEMLSQARNLVPRHMHSARGRAPRTGRNQAASTTLQHRAHDSRPGIVVHGARSQCVQPRAVTRLPARPICF